MLKIITCIYMHSNVSSAFDLFISSCDIEYAIKKVNKDFTFNFAGEFSLLSDGSSPNTSAGNTPDSGDALDESTDSGVSGPASLPPTLSASSTASSLSNTSVEKRSVRELAASLNKSKADRKENGKRPFFNPMQLRFSIPHG